MVRGQGGLDLDYITIVLALGCTISPTALDNTRCAWRSDCFASPKDAQEIMHCMRQAASLDKGIRSKDTWASDALQAVNNLIQAIRSF
jgi:hypothetical protein